MLQFFEIWLRAVIITTENNKANKLYVERTTPCSRKMGMSKWADLVDTLDVKCLDSYEFIFSPFHDNLLNGTNNDIIFNLNPKIISLDKQKSYIYDRSWIISFLNWNE